MNPIRPATKPIGRRLTVLIVGFSTFIALFSTGIQLFQDYRQQRNDLEHLLDNPPLSSASIAESVWAFDEKQTMLAIQAIGRLPDIDYVAVEATHGKTPWTIGAVRSSNNIVRVFPLDYVNQKKTHHLGTLTIIANLDRINDRVFSLALVVLGTNFLKTVFVAGLMLILFRHLVTRRLENLSRKVSGLASPYIEQPRNGTKASGCATVGGDEIDALQETFDDMERQLSIAAARQNQSHHELRQSNAELERRINAQQLAETELGRLNASLEQRVLERVKELTLCQRQGEATNARLKIEIAVREEAEEALLLAKNGAEEANAAKSRFLAAASHDLRQPIQAIGLFASALSRSPLTQSQQALCGQLEMACRDLGVMLGALLDVSRLDSGVIESHPRPIEVHQLFQQIEREFAPLAAAKKLRFKLFFSHRPVVFSADPELLMGLLRNVIGNAIKYTERGGLLVGARKRGGCLAIEVWDTGIGIGHEHLSKIYDEYYQVNNQHRDREAGVGLGLSIVRRLANLMDCPTDCRSLPGRGTVFEIRLPVAQEQSGVPMPQAPVAGDERMNVNLSGRQIVLIEDDLLVANSLQEWLEAHGASVSAFPDAPAALAFPQLLDADCFISDFRLRGDMNGAQLLDAIQQRAPHPIKALLITGDTAVEQINDFASIPWDLLHKPIAPAELLAALTAKYVS